MTSYDFTRRETAAARGDGAPAYRSPRRGRPLLRPSRAGLEGEVRALGYEGGYDAVRRYARKARPPPLSGPSPFA